MAVIQPLPRIHVVRWASPFGEAVQGAERGFIPQYFQQIRFYAFARWYVSNGHY